MLHILSFQPTQAGDIRYDYDDNGNLLAEYTSPRETGTVTAPPVTTDDTGLSSMPLGIGIAVTDPHTMNGYTRRFGWNEENQLVWSNNGNNVVTYRYGADGERTLKYRSSSESLYFDSMWTCQTDGGSLRESKHIFVGQTRIATRLSIRGNVDNSYPLVNTYYYHGDHLGSAQTVTDYRGALYERLEYTPYGELWVEQKTDTDPVAKIPYRFTGKEYDTETGLYAFGARYLNPVTGMWISADPALLDGSFLPVAPTSDEARKKNSNLPGMGGVFNGLNFGSFGYSHCNPVLYSDPNGKAPRNLDVAKREAYIETVKSVTPTAIPDKYDCADTALYIYSKAMETSTGQKDAYKNVSKNGAPLTNLQNIQAGDTFGSANQQNKIINFYDNSGLGQTYNSSKADKSFNSPNIEVGTVGIYGPKAGATGFTGHTITVTGVVRDSSNNVISIDYIEGHMEGADQQAHTFTRESGLTGEDSLQNRYDDTEFLGWGEFEPAH